MLLMGTSSDLDGTCLAVQDQGILTRLYLALNGFLWTEIAY